MASWIRIRIRIWSSWIRIRDARIRTSLVRTPLIGIQNPSEKSTLNMDSHIAAQIKDFILDSESRIFLLELKSDLESEMLPLVTFGRMTIAICIPKFEIRPLNRS